MYCVLIRQKALQTRVCKAFDDKINSHRRFFAPILRGAKAFVNKNRLAELTQKSGQNLIE